MSNDFEMLKERAENTNTLLMKAQRDKEAIQTDLEVIKERYDKSHSIQQKLQVFKSKSRDGKMFDSLITKPAILFTNYSN